MAPLFSVIIPTYNSATKVVRAINSVLAQTFDNYEIWVIDDGSTDGTCAALASFGAQIHICYQPNQGAAVARNQGIAQAHGTYIAFLDADDWWYPQKLARFANAIHSYPESGLLYSPVDFFTATGRKLWTYVSEDRGKGNYIALLQRDFVLTSSAIARRHCFSEVGTFDRTLSHCEDWDMWIRIARHFPLHRVPEALTAYEYMAGDSLTSSTRRWIQAHDQLLAKILHDDPSLSNQQRRAVRSAFAYRKGKIYLAAGEEQSALQSFRQARGLSWFNWQAWLYELVLALPPLRRHLPRRIQRALRLPGAHPEIMEQE